MTLQQIKYFIDAAESGSISETAKRMYVAQSSVSSAIKELERFHGVQLFHRNAKGVALTGAGEELLIELRVVVKKMDFLQHKYHERGTKSITFSVAAQHHIFGLEPFISVAREITSKKYKLCFLESCTSDILENVERGYADIGIFFFADPISKQVLQEIRNHSLQYHSLGTEMLHAHLRKDHPLAEKTSISISDLMSYPCITYDHILRSNPLSGEAIASCPRKIGTTDRAVAYSLLCNLDAFLTGSSYCSPEERNQNIVARPIQNSYLIHLVWVAREHYKPSEIAQHFIDLLPRF